MEREGVDIFGHILPFDGGRLGQPQELGRRAAHELKAWQRGFDRDESALPLAETATAKTAKTAIFMGAKDLKPTGEACLEGFETAWRDASWHAEDSIDFNFACVHLFAYLWQKQCCLSGIVAKQRTPLWWLRQGVAWKTYTWILLRNFLRLRSFNLWKTNLNFYFSLIPKKCENTVPFFLLKVLLLFSIPLIGTPFCAAAFVSLQVKRRKLSSWYWWVKFQGAARAASAGYLGWGGSGGKGRLDIDSGRANFFYFCSSLQASSPDGKVRLTKVDGLQHAKYSAVD